MTTYCDILLTVDYDRTLTAPDSTIPESNLEAIREFMALGGAFTVNTGRSLPMVRSFLDKVPVNAPFLLYNGSGAYDAAADRLTQLHEIPLELWQTVNACVQLFPDLTVEVQGLDAHYQITRKPGYDRFCQANQCAFRLAEPGMELGPFLKFSLFGQLREESVAGLFSGTPQEIARMDQVELALRERFGTWCEVFRAAPRIIDVHAKGVSKARAARELQKKLGRKILVCIGDAENDLPMLLDADFAFVPGDSILKGRFPTVCSCAEGAVAEVIRKKIPEILGSTEK